MPTTLSSASASSKEGGSSSTHISSGSGTGGSGTKFLPTPGVEVYHEGSKSYWKVRASLDLLVVCHTAHLCVEVIAFDPERGLEANRLYLNSVLLAGKVDQQELQTKLAEKKEALLRQKKLVNATLITKELLVQGMTNYVLQRLQILTLTDSKFEVGLMPSAEEQQADGQELDVVIAPPRGLTPLLCTFAKKVKTSDIHTALNNLKAEEKALRSATKIAELATSSVDGFKLMLAEKIKRDQEMRNNYSPARLLWIKAINRVLVQNYVEKVKERLISMGMYKPPEEEVVVNSPSKFQIAHIHIPMFTRSKTVRRTIDNSLLQKGESMPNLGESAPMAGHLPAVRTPLKDASSKRRERSNKVVDAVRARRSLNGEIFNSIIGSEKKSPTYLSGPVPTLLQSYSEVSKRIEPLTPVVMLSELKGIASMAGSQKVPTLVK